MKLVFKDVSYFVDGGKPQYQEKKTLELGKSLPCYMCTCMYTEKIVLKGP